MVQVFDGADFSIKPIFGPQHMRAAAHFARLSGRVEKEHAGTNISDETRSKHRAYVTASIMSCVASLEAVINEFYIDATDWPPRFKMLAPEVPSILAKHAKQKASTLKKYQTALLKAGKERFNLDHPPYKTAEHVVALRNMLTHYRAEWHDRQAQHKRIAERLGQLFAPNPFGHGTFFPNRCLGYGCAEWAVRSSVEFVDAFFLRLDMPSVFDGFRERLHTNV